MKACFEHNRKELALCLCGTVLLLAILAFGLLANAITDFGNKDEKCVADVAVVLGAAVTDSEVMPVFRERLNHGIWLYQNGYVDYLILTGGVGEGNTLSEAYVAKQYVLSQGIPEAVILIEEASEITEENMANAKGIMDAQGWESAIIVSDPLHMKRAMQMACDCGMRAYSSPTPTTMYRSARTKLPFLLRELFYYTGYMLLRPFR